MEIPIVFITDNNYVIPTGVAITSLILNKKPKTLYKIFVIVTEEVTKENKKKLIKCGKHKVTVELIEFDASTLKRFSVHGYYVLPTALLKFNIPNLLPQYEKIIYLDGDIIVKGDLTEFFTNDVSDVYLGAVSDYAAVVTMQIYDRLKLTNYFNSGVLLINSARMREENFEELLYKIKEQNPDYLCMDQDVLNTAANEKVLFLPVKYNVMLHNFLYPACEGIDGINKYYNTSYISFGSLLNDAIIVHLTNEVKSWKYKDGLLHKEWMKVFKRSPFRFQKLNLSYHKEKIPFKQKQKRKLKNVIKNFPFIKQLNNRYWEIKNILQENNLILKDIAFKLGKEKQLARLQSWDLIKSREIIPSLEREIREIDTN
jgi:lipopolysaccharide biosynthesis glycosyltransferase